MPKKIRVYRGIEREIKNFGLSLDDYMLLLFVAMFSAVIITLFIVLFDTGIQPLLWVFLAQAIVFVILRRANKRTEHPTLVFSWQSFLVNQPKKIIVDKDPQTYSIAELRSIDKNDIQEE